LHTDNFLITHNKFLIAPEASLHTEGGEGVG